MWGMSLGLNLRGCNAEIMQSEKMLREFIISLCGHIGMKRHKDVQIEFFGEEKESKEGYSAFQWITTSSITLHCDHYADRVFIDIFSCKDFDIKDTTEFCFKYFKAKELDVNLFNRK